MTESEFDAWTIKLYQKAVRLGLSADQIKGYVMTKLEEEMLMATHVHVIRIKEDKQLSCNLVAMAAAKVAKKYIEKAYNAEAAEYMNQSALTAHNIMKEKWLKENGIIE